MICAKWSRLGAALVIASAVGGLAACGDKPQTAGTAKKTDAKAWDGGANTAYAAEGWKAGDQASWEQQLKARSQHQNEYTRAR